MAVLWKYIKKQMLKYPTSTISEGVRTFSYIEFINEVEKLSEKIKGEECCGAYCEKELNQAIVLLACISAGVIAVPVSSRYGDRHCNKILDSISPSCIASDVSGEVEFTAQNEYGFILPKEQVSVIMCTSGTTGAPKGVMLSETNLLANLKDIDNYFNIDCFDTIFISRPLYHCAVLTGEFLVSLVNGANIVFSSQKFDPLNIVRTINNKQITCFGGTPTIISILAELSDRIQINLKKIVISGECMSKSVGDRIRKAFPTAEIYHVYGLTEASPRVSYLPPQFFSDYSDSVGIPLNSVKVKLLDDKGRKVKKNTPGILWIKGKNVMVGYYNAKKQTDLIIKNGWLCTKDVAFIDENGFLKIKGRSDDMIIRAGMNIYPQEIEAELKKDIRTREVLVYGVKSEGRETQIALRISGKYKNTDEIKKLCIDYLPAFQVPTIIELVDKIEKNGSGKIIRGEKSA